MTAFPDLDATMGATLIQTFGQRVTYRKCTGEVVTGIYATIDLNVQNFGDTASGAAEYRNEIMLVRADVGEPHRGDAIITAAGTVYTVQDLVEEETDKVQVKVTVK